MGADFSRIRSDPLLDFAGVELKQGGVVLDGDVNELGAIIDRRLRALASDVLGRSTVSSTTPLAFRITAGGGTLQIGRGRLYVDGLLAENHGAASDDANDHAFDPLLAEPTFTDPIRYDAQPYLPDAPALPTAGRHLVYLDVWNRSVTHLERPELVEVAVGVESSSRVQTVWQVRVHAPDLRTATCATPDDEIAGWSALTAPSTGRLTTGTFEVPPADDPCELPPSGGYRGLENQTLSNRDPRPRPARRRRHLQVVARERERRQPGREHRLGNRARASVARPRRHPAPEHRRLGRDRRRRSRAVAAERRDAPHHGQRIGAPHHVRAGVAGRDAAGRVP
jgi:hypothetical protein